MMAHFGKNGIQIIGAALTFTLVSCGGNARNFTSASSNGPSNPAVGTATSDAFYVRVYDQGLFPYYTNQAGAWGTDCSIANGLTSQDIICYIDMNEGDLYASPLSLQYNVPPSMCAYLDFKPYWYFNSEVGFGPSSYTEIINEDANGNVTSVECSVNGVPASPSVAGCSNPAITVDQYTGTLLCAYNQSQSLYGGPNCCFGEYNAVVTVNSNGTGSTSYLNQQQWNDSETAVETCIGGPIRTTNWQYYTARGIPESLVTYTENLGVNSTFNMVPPISNPNGSTNVPIANFYGDVDHTHSGGTPHRTSTLPYAVDPIEDLSGNDLVHTDPSLPLIGQDSYEFRCEDRAFEVINRIRVYIRSWNTYADFLAYGSSNGVTYNPNVIGPEGTNCVGVAGDCHDRLKWDDIPFAGSAPSPFPSPVPTPWPAASTGYYFPNELYQ
jgi:hypothetical protein